MNITPAADKRFILAALCFILCSTALPRLGLAENKINTVSEIQIDSSTNERKIWIKTAEKPTFTVFRLNHPFRVVIDVSGGDLSNLQSSEFSNDDILNNIILRQFNANGFTIGRVMLQFSQEVEYECAHNC